MRSFLPIAVLASSLGAGLLSAHADGPASIRIGYAVSKTGPYAGASNTLTLPNYRLWVKDVNDAGGIMLKSIGRRVPIEVIEYDDQSDPTEALKAIEQLAVKDKVDFILAPWGTNFNLALAPLFNRYGYPQLMATAQVERAAEMAKTSPYTFFANGRSAEIAGALVGFLSAQRAEGKLGNDVAIMHIADAFGTVLATPVLVALKREKFNIVYQRTYPVGTRDMRPMMQQAMASNPDAFLAFSYPADTMAITVQAIDLGFNPKVFYVAVGTAFSSFKQKFGANVEGVAGMGGWDASSPALQAYFRHHVEVIGSEPDRWASPLGYAMLQVLQQAIERVGKVDREAIRDVIRSETFETVMGPVNFEGNLLKQVWYMGQWQDGEYHGIAPSTMQGARPFRSPKPAWRAAE
jgi:branched-chain amino acid transport system substrate-binding protein